MITVGFRGSYCCKDDSFEYYQANFDLTETQKECLQRMTDEQIDTDDDIVETDAILREFRPLLKSIGNLYRYLCDEATYNTCEYRLATQVC
jgi:hypothetical protein